MKKILIRKLSKVIARERGIIEDNLVEIFCGLSAIGVYLSDIEKKKDHGYYNTSSILSALQRDLSWIDGQLNSLEVSLEYIKILRRDLKMVERRK